MNDYRSNDYSKLENQIQNCSEITLTRHFQERLRMRNIRIKFIRHTLTHNPKIIRHECTYSYAAKLKIRYTLQGQDDNGNDFGIVLAVKNTTIVLITIFYFSEEKGWMQQENKLYLKE